MAGTSGDLWLQWFTCCYQPTATTQRTRRRIDRSMIGAPTNFKHTGHLGCNEVEMVPNSLLHAVQKQMQGKGGYEAYEVKVY